MINYEEIKLNEYEMQMIQRVARYSKFKYIARDISGRLFCYEEKPSKFWKMWTSEGKLKHAYMYDSSFQFIKWEDKEPYKIDELLKCEVVEDD